jgi:hypothetical protein
VRFCARQIASARRSAGLGLGEDLGLFPPWAGREGDNQVEGYGDWCVLRDGIP